MNLILLQYPARPPAHPKRYNASVLLCSVMLASAPREPHFQHGYIPNSEERPLPAWVRTLLWCWFTFCLTLSQKCPIFVLHQLFTLLSIPSLSFQQYCAFEGGHLVSIHNRSENLLVKALIRLHESMDVPTWIGLSDCQQVGTWKKVIRATSELRNCGRLLFSMGDDVIISEFNSVQFHFIVVIPIQGCSVN